MKKKMRITKKTAALLAFLAMSTSGGFELWSQEADDDFVVPLDQDFSKPIETVAADAPASGGGNSVKMGLWTEIKSDNVSLIRNVSDGTKKGYEFDNSHFYGEMNWWFWGKPNSWFTLDAEVGVLNFDKTLYQANSYGANVPDVTWADGFQELVSMPFSLIKGGNDETPGVFNKLGLNLETSFIDVRFGYGKLKKNGMSQFAGIYNVIDQEEYVGDGYTELKNGKNLREFGDVKIDALVAFSRMNVGGSTYGMYDYIDAKYSDLAELALTFGSTTTEEQLFFYDRTNNNAGSVYAAVTPIDGLKAEFHALGFFNAEHHLSAATGAIAGRISYEADSWKVSVKESAAGEFANSVWGSDGKAHDDINADTFTTQIDLWKRLDNLPLGLSFGLDQGITFYDTDGDEPDKRDYRFRTEPYADFDLDPIFSHGLTFGTYGVFTIDKIAEKVSADQEIATALHEIGFEVKAANLAKYLKKITFDYAIKNKYTTEDSFDEKYTQWTSGNSYSLNKSYHSIIVDADITDRLGLNAGAIVRAGNDDDTNVPFAFSLGARFKQLPLPGKPMLWAHFTYGMNPYEDNGYSLYRYDEANEKYQHRTYRLNSLDSEATKSHISVGLIWDL